MNLVHLLRASARRLPQAPALAHGTRTVATYAGLAGRAERLAAGMLERHRLSPGDRIRIGKTVIDVRK